MVLGCLVLVLDRYSKCSLIVVWLFSHLVWLFIFSLFVGQKYITCIAKSHISYFICVADTSLQYNTDTTLTITNIEKHHEGMYQCIARSKLGMTFATSRLRVRMYGQNTTDIPDTPYEMQDIAPDSVPAGRSWDINLYCWSVVDHEMFNSSIATNYKCYIAPML